MINILIGWNVLLTLITVFIIAFNGERMARIDKVEADIENNKVYDIVVDSAYSHWHPSYLGDCQQRIITVKEAIACLYEKLDFEITYTPEENNKTPEDVSIR